MGDIFISYSRTDTDYAHKLTEILQSRGLHIWIDERVDDRTGWPRKLRKRIDSCDACIVIMTPHSFASPWVQKELKHAKQKSKPIFPLWLKGDEPWVSIEATQFYDARKDGLPESRFYSDLKLVVAASQTDATSQVPKASVNTKTAIRSTWVRVAIAIVRVVAIVFLIGAVTLAGPSGQKFLNSSARSLVNLGIAGTPMALLMPVATPEPILVIRNYQIALCCGYPGIQRPTLLNFSISVETMSMLQIKFDMEKDPVACSDMILHILWDNAEIYLTDAIGPTSDRNTTGLIDLSRLISRGRHILTISPEGLAGGCNFGGLPAWAGKLIVHTSAPPR